MRSNVCDGKKVGLVTKPRCVQMSRVNAWGAWYIYECIDTRTPALHCYSYGKCNSADTSQVAKNCSLTGCNVCHAMKCNPSHHLDPNVGTWEGISAFGDPGNNRDSNPDFNDRQLAICAPTELCMS